MVIEDTASLGRTLQEAARKLNELQVQREEHLIATKGRFNLFTVLLKESDETRLHSRYLAHLLDPNGTHDCRTLFLKLFLKLLKERGVQPHEDAAPREKLQGLNVEVSFDPKNVSVQAEVVVREGRLDILMESRNWGAITVENKIGAFEGNKQIERYADYLKRRQYSASLLLYLTLHGDSSTTANGKTYYRISYDEHIREWLEECLRATYSHVNLNQALQQYKNVVCKLVGRPTLETEYMEKIKHVVRANPDIVANWTDLNEAVSQLREEYRKTLLGELKERLHGKGIRLGDPEGTLLPLTQEPAEKLSFGKITIRVSIDHFVKGRSALICGAWSDDTDENSEKEFSDFLEAVRSRTPEYNYSDYNSGWAGFYYYVPDGEWWSDEQLTRHLNHPEDYKKIVDSWVPLMSKFVETVVSVCKERQ